MKSLKGADYNAVGIEYSFAFLLGLKIGVRGRINDADVFRIGSVKKLGKLIEATASSLQERCNKIKFSAEEVRDGDNKPKTFVAIKGLKDIAKEMKNSRDKEPDDYHWLIIGELIQIIDSILRHHKI